MQVESNATLARCYAVAFGRRGEDGLTAYLSALYHAVGNVFSQTCVWRDEPISDHGGDSKTDMNH